MVESFVELVFGLPIWLLLGAGLILLLLGAICRCLSD
jgi:hypothetical protein